LGVSLDVKHKKLIACLLISRWLRDWRDANKIEKWTEVIDLRYFSKRLDLCYRTSPMGTTFALVEMISVPERALVVFMLTDLRGV
jgi:hypothetical protein